MITLCHRGMQYGPSQPGQYAVTGLTFLTAVIDSSWKMQCSPILNNGQCILDDMASSLNIPGVCHKSPSSNSSPNDPTPIQ